MKLIEGAGLSGEAYVRKLFDGTVDCHTFNISEELREFVESSAITKATMGSESSKFSEKYFEEMQEVFTDSMLEHNDAETEHVFVVDEIIRLKEEAERLKGLDNAVSDKVLEDIRHDIFLAEQKRDECMGAVMKSLITLPERKREQQEHAQRATRK